MSENLSRAEMAKIIDMARAVKALDAKREERSQLLAQSLLAEMSEEQVDRALKLLDKLSQPQNLGSPKE